MKKSFEAKRRNAKITASRRRRRGTMAVCITLGLLAFIGVTLAFWWSLASDVDSARAAMAADTPSDGIGRVYTADATLYAAPTAQAEEGTALRVWCETDENLPAWWNPSEAELVYQAPIAQPTHGDALDYNLNTTLWGWDGHRMEVWEMELFARIFYREFWQPNLMLCEAGCDAMLGLWELDGGTMYETLSHINEDGSYSFSTFPGVWESEYDPDGLAWCRAYCEERFYEGPSWPAQYFRKGHYHDWGEWSPIPAYEIDGIYFSIGKEQ